MITFVVSRGEYRENYREISLAALVSSICSDLLLKLHQHPRQSPPPPFTCQHGAGTSLHQAGPDQDFLGPFFTASQPAPPAWVNGLRKFSI